MKQIFFTLVALLVSTVAWAAGPKMTFQETECDFGTIKASDGEVSATYHFTNTGDKPLVIKSVTNGGCGCTTPSYPKQPISPGASGKIVIKFNPEGRRGEFTRQVKVSTNAGKKRLSLKFSGAIIP